MLRLLVFFIVCTSTLALGRAELPTYRIPVENAELKEISQFKLQDFEIKTGDRDELLKFAYTIPSQLVGNQPPVKVLAHSTMPRSLIESFETFPVRAILVDGPCHLNASKQKLSPHVSLCAYTSANDPRVKAVGKGRCRWQANANKLNCEMQYSNMAEVYGIEPAENYLDNQDLLPADKEKYLLLAALFGHDAVGVLSFDYIMEFEEK